METARFNPVPTASSPASPQEAPLATDTLRALAPMAPPAAAETVPPQATARERDAVLALFRQTPLPKRAAPPEPRTPVARPAAPSKASAEPTMSSDASTALARVLQTGDNGRAPFIIIDKRNARLWLFDSQGQARGNTAVLLGLARGDDTVPGIGDKPLARIKVGERTTPAGRFVAEPGRNARGDDIFWVDYAAAVSMHRVHDVDRGDYRIQRLRSPSTADNRISYGCINLPAEFYDQTLLPLVGGQHPVVYLLPETRPVDTIFQPAAAAYAGRATPPTSKGS